MKNACLSFILLASVGCIAEEVDPEVGESTAAIEPGFCTGICHADTPCDIACLTMPGLEEITCGEYGRCQALADPDNDGVQSGQDNCDFTYNPNQANCDGDAKGDACDPENGTWVLDSTAERKYVGHVNGNGLGCDIWNSIRYIYRDVSSCGGGQRAECDRYYFTTVGELECGLFSPYPICN